LAKIENKTFSLIDFLKKNKPRILCLSLHWHQQLFEVISLSNEIKRIFPSLKIILGGWTASYFYREIMKNYKSIDFIIRGESEDPLLELAKRILTKKNNFEDIPNLSWRKGDLIVNNKQIYCTPLFLFNKLRFSNFNLVINKKFCLKGLWGLNKNADSKDYRERENIFFYNPGRGCLVNCSFCSGSNLTQKILNGKSRVIFKTKSSVIRDLRESKWHGIGSIYTCFDPKPFSNYYPNLFKLIRKEKLCFKMNFECWSLPTKKFIDSFKNTFNPDSRLIISPESGSERVRRLNKGFFYTNKDLLRTIRYLKEKEVEIELYFTTGLPFETKKDFIETVIFIKYLRKKFKFKLSAHPIEIEPCSLMYLNSSKYKIKLKRKSFEDFVRDSSRPVFSLGYETNYFKEEEIISNVNLLRNL